MSDSLTDSSSPTLSSNGAPIGVFDSGLGGLRVLDRLMQALPEERFVYLGDTLHMPYGHKTQEQVCEYFTGCLDWLFAQHRVKMMLVACNTASAVASSVFNRYAPVPFVDPVTPICRWLVAEGRYRKLGVLATPATVASNRYPNLLDTLQASMDLYQVPCENLATVIEEGGVDTPACEALLQQYVAPLNTERVDAIVLGCTHYPYAHARIAELAPDAEILDPDVFMVLEVKRLLQAHELLNPARTGRTLAEVEYFVTAKPEQFYETSRRMPFRALAMKQPTVISVERPLPLSTNS
jgi:glutamate racemase